MLRSGVYGFFRGELCEYIGSSADMTSRLKGHVSGRESNIILQSVIAKYGLSSLRWLVLEECEPDEISLRSCEQIWMNDLKPRCNIAPVAGSCLGMKHTDETRARMSAADMGRKHTGGTKAKISAGMKRYACSLAGREQLRKAARMGGAKSKGRKHTEETKAKMRASRHAYLKQQRGEI